MDSCLSSLWRFRPQMLPKTAFLLSSKRYILLNLSYFLVPRVPKNSKADLGLYTLSVQKVIPSCNSPFTFDFLLCVTSSLSTHPCFFRPSVCPSIPLSVSLPPVSRTVRPLKLLVYLSTCPSVCWNFCYYVGMSASQLLFVCSPVRLYFLLNFVILISANTVEPLMDTSLATSEHRILNLP